MELARVGASGLTRIAVVLPVLWTGLVGASPILVGVGVVLRPA
jgi:hypothetical protein